MAMLLGVETQDIHV